MAIYENKFKIGDVVWFKHLGNQYSGWYNLVRLFGLSELHGCTKSTKCTVKNYTLHTNEHNKVFVYLLEDDDKNNYLVNDEAIEFYNGQDKEQTCKVESCKKVTKTGYVKCEKFTSICEYLTEGKVYSVKDDNGCILIKNNQGEDTWLVSVGRQCYHTGSVWQYATEEEYLAQQTPKQQYKQRAKWVKNTGEKPDLPDGTLVKVKWSDGDTFEYKVDEVEWKLAPLSTSNIIKWKLADDWNKVVDGQAPDIEAATIVEVENTKEYMGNKFIGRVSDFKWEAVKKWRYAKEKKAK